MQTHEKQCWEKKLQKDTYGMNLFTTCGTQNYTLCIYIYFFKVYNMKWNDTYEILSQERGRGKDTE